MDFSIILSKFKSVKKKGKGYIAICPAHPDKEASLSLWHDVSEGKTVLTCHAGCEISDILDAAGLKISDLFDRSLPVGDYDSRFERIYQYQSSNGNVLFEKVRFKATETKKKNFTQRRKIGDAIVWGLEGGVHFETYPGSNEWTKNLGKKINPLEQEFESCEPVLYNLPVILKAIAAGEEVHIAEGEKDADNLTTLGFPCCCNFDGASASKLKPKWRKSYNKIFKGAKVVIFNDNDNPGRTHADYIARELNEVAEYVKRPDLPGILDKEDITDFISAGNGENEIREVIDSTSVYEYDDAEEQSLINYNFSDVGNAERLMAIYGKNIRYNPVRRSWLLWSSKHWEFDFVGKIEGLSRKVIRKLQTEGDDITLEGLPYDEQDKKEKLKQSIKKYVLRSESDGKIKAMVNQAMTQNSLIITETDKNNYLLNIKNGTLNLKTGLLEKHDRRNFCTKVIDVEYDPKTQCPNWTSFINKIFMEDQELINYIQKSVGYSMTGDANLQCFYILHGNGANGKGTFIKTIMRFLGDYSDSLDAKSIMEKMGDEGTREEIAGLLGKRFVSVNEMKGSKSFDEGLLKSMTSGADETVKVRNLYESSFNLKPTFKLWMSTNHMPKINNDDDGIWRRIRKIPFKYKFVDGDKDVNFFENKLLPEMPGILNWAIEGCLKWQQEGECIPDVVKASVDEYRIDSDPIQRFIADECIVANSETVRVNVPDMYKCYESWCKENKEYTLSSIKFTKKMNEKEFEKGRSNSGLYWKGIGLLDKDHQVNITECNNKFNPFVKD
ncbi:phage/plasmid primase, P4 family [Clostridium lacusfryxellense]|uniref:phage/plasmid primase, P4 family n=1 Tax=Clostridium lacusfryxellense TaxID=205328 RepID=UPI001C0E1D48|nr:phage/plasmid primase, P4 family [Clostridium lacusfryxellense]MBU3111976.1 toprim domain-containing protein [Clostridium lacusfryxellense]